MKDETSENSVLLARSALHQQSAMVLKSRQPATLVLLLLDRSGSMQPYDDTPRLAANECLQTVQGMPGAEHTMVAIFTFGSDVTLDVKPQPVKSVKPLATYRAEGNTKLYEAVYGALFVALEFHAVAQQNSCAVKVAISVITDGEDTLSPEYHGKLLELARQARDRGFTLQALGIGIDSKKLARDLGFEESYARTVEATAEGVREAAEESSVLFSITMMHNLNQEPEPATSQTSKEEDSDSRP